MARRVSNGNYLQRDEVVASAPMTLAAWSRRESITGRNTLIGCADNNGTINYWYIGHVTTNAECTVRPNDVGATKTSATATSSTGWEHIAGTFNSSWQPLLYVNGVAGTRNTSNSSAPIALDNISHGHLDRSSDLPNGDPCHIAWPCIWDVELTADEINGLAFGVHPLRIRPGNIVYFVPMTGASDGNEIDIIGQRTITETGTVTATESYPVSVQGAVFPGFTLDTGTSIPVFQHHYQQMGAS